ncbi:MAG: indolepyruvate oxidoreductase subunit beta [Deltaproteobacteria bacterium]|nr:MAG: indolepyruvate oxidoreductase subunit beta [Deltaproteobacteria bacterium]
MESSGNVLFCGVGGQGIILASEILGLVLMRAGFDVKKSEVHGMAQRGGSVEAHLRYGEKVYSPLIGKGEADVVLAFEKLESLRYRRYMSEKTAVLVNTQEIFPPSVATGVEEYPRGVLETLESWGVRVYPIDAFSLARKAGEVRAVNSVLLGALSTFLPVDETLFFDVISERIPSRYKDANLKAFSLGRSGVTSRA